MKALKALAILLVVAGSLGLLYGGFSYVTATHSANIGPLHMQMNETRDVNVPLWLSVAAVVGGVLLLVTPRKR